MYTQGAVHCPTLGSSQYAMRCSCFRLSTRLVFPATSRCVKRNVWRPRAMACTGCGVPPPSTERANNNDANGPSSNQQTEQHRSKRDDRGSEEEHPDCLFIALRAQVVCVGSSDGGLWSGKLERLAGCWYTHTHTPGLNCKEIRTIHELCSEPAICSTSVCSTPRTRPLLDLAAATDCHCRYVTCCGYHYYQPSPVHHTRRPRWVATTNTLYTLALPIPPHSTPGCLLPYISGRAAGQAVSM